MSIRDGWLSIRPSNRFLFAYPFWLAILFGIFYWGTYWELSPIGHYLDSLQRAGVMELLNALLPNHIVNHDIIISSHYHIIITPECNGLVPYYIYLAAVLAYANSLWCKLEWAFLGYIVISIANMVRLVAVVFVVNKFGQNSFYFIHNIIGNILLIAVGSALFLLYLKRCHAK